VLQCVAVCCSVLQCVAVCCSVLQCVAVCCSVLQWITHAIWIRVGFLLQQITHDILSVIQPKVQHNEHIRHLQHLHDEIRLE